MVALGFLPKTFPANPNAHQNAGQALACAASEGQAQSIRASLIAEFAPAVLSDLLHERPMDVGGPMHIELTKDARPVYCSAPRKVPVRFEAEAEATVKELLRKGVIAQVTEPTRWCSPAFFVPKPDGKRVRLVTDYTKLNEFIHRPTHPFPSSRDIMQSISADAKVFAKIDTVHGYFQLTLDNES